MSALFDARKPIFRDRRLIVKDHSPRDRNSTASASPSMPSFRAVSACTPPELSHGQPEFAVVSDRQFGFYYLQKAKGRARCIHFQFQAVAAKLLYRCRPAIINPHRSYHKRSYAMVKTALYVHLEAKPGKEADVQKFLEGGLALVNQEPATTAWFGMKMGPNTFGIFDAFPDEAGRNAHLNGAVAAALMAKASELFAAPPKIQKVDILAAKLPK
jgi:quinol monooxygenase YgiN